jgi:hypothetical protein
METERDGCLPLLNITLYKRLDGLDHKVYWTRMIWDEEHWEYTVSLVCQAYIGKIGQLVHTPG